MKRLFMSIILLVFYSFPKGNATEPTDSLIHLDEVVITANKIKVNRNSVPLSISVVEREKIDSSSESALLPVLSERVPGLFVTEKGITGFGVSSGAAGTVNIRGVGQGNKVLMLFDGQPQWAGIFGHSLPDTYVASDVERVEVIRGPGSLMYGSNAMGGVVNIITRQQKTAGRHTQARLMYGSYNTQKYMINNGYNIDRFSTFISLNHDRTDGHRANSKFHITNGFAKIGYEINEKYKVTGDVSLAAYNNQNPGPVTNPILDNVMDILRGTASLNFSSTGGAIQTFYNWGVHDINDGYNPGKTPRTYLFHSNDHNTGILAYHSFHLLPGNSFTIGADFKNWGGSARNDSINGIQEELIDKSVHELGGYLIVQQELFTLLSLNAGIRYEHNSTFGGEWIPQVGFAFRPLKGNVIKASLSKGFRSPNIREMYMFPPQNPDLSPESMLNYEVAVNQSFLEGRLFTEFTGFYIDGKDMIETVVTDGRPRNSNTGSFTNKGVELEARYQIVNNLSLDMNYSYLHTNKPLLAAPAHKFFAGLVYSPGKFTINMNLQSIFDLYINTVNQLKEDYTLLNAKVSYQYGTREKGIIFFIKGENLTTTRYSINEGFPMPKAIFLGGIDISF